MVSSVIIYIVFHISITNAIAESPPCSINEHYTDCVEPCLKPTCTNPQPIGPPGPKICHGKCKPGCVCDDGYIKTTNKSDAWCIWAENCKNCANPDFEFRECGTKCRTTCKSVLSKNTLCSFICIPGCYCKAPKVLDEAKNICVTRDQCKNDTSN
ncbi:hypothetical protein HHI36_010050 [Cryptolaemus montrouzieri]|uniref:TIL domain-containing protein n=1 Tax=Cryptolaemus montrouzieri TaxID=559131 RepID=A0ABD2MHL8_9CUCU